MNHHETAGVEALAEAIDYKSLPFSTIPEPEHAFDIARTILTSDWLAAHVAAEVGEALAPVRALADGWLAADVDRKAFVVQCGDALRAALPDSPD